MKRDIILVTIFAFLLIGFAFAQSLIPLGTSSIVGTISQVPEGLQELEFTPSQFNAGDLVAGEQVSYLLEIRNPNTVGLNITFEEALDNQAASVIVQVRQNGNWFDGEYREIRENQILVANVTVIAGTCAGCPAIVPYTVELIFSGIEGPIPQATVNAAFPIEILNIETHGENGTIAYNATYQNASAELLQIDALVRREERNTTLGFEALDGQAEVMFLNSGESNVFSGEFAVLGTTGIVYQLQFEALTPPPGEPLADLIQVDVVMKGEQVQGEPAGEPIDENPIVGAELDTINESTEEPVFTPLMQILTIMGGLGIAATIILFYERSKKQ